MKGQPTEPAFSILSTCLLLIAVVSALVSIVKDYQPIWPVAEWICGISVLALVASLIYDARK